MTTFRKIITNKYLWIAIITVGLFYWGKLYLVQTSIVKQKVAAPRLKFKKDLYGINFINSKKGWVVGKDGLIAHTVDKGENWKIQKSNVTVNLAKVRFIDILKGFAVGGEGTLLMTVNGGGTWQKKDTGTKAYLNGICFPTADNGFVVGELGTVLSTKNSGKTWHRDNSLFKDALPWEVPELKSIYFSSPKTGWIVGEFGKVLKTVDGGLSWNIVDMSTRDTLFGVCFFDRNNGYIVGIGGLILATEDGGQTWVRDKEFKRKDNFYHVAYRDHKKKVPLYIAGSGELIMMPNENTRFKSQMIDNFNIENSWLFDIDFVSSNQAYAVGKSGLILHISRGEGDVWGKLDYNVLKG